MDDWKGIDLRGRKMLHAPWIHTQHHHHLKRGKPNLFPQPPEVIQKIVTAFYNAGGSVPELADMLNNHIPDREYQLGGNDLVSAIHFFSLEYYFYVVQFSKLLLWDENFYYNKGEESQLGVHHRIIEQGPMRFPPWLPEGDFKKGYLSITNMTSMFTYIEETVIYPPFSDGMNENIGSTFSKEALSFLNAYAPAEYQVERSFFDREEILISFEYLFYISCFFEMLTNDENFSFNSLYYGTKFNNNLAKAIFLQPALSPVESFQQWQFHTNNVYNMDLSSRGKTLWVGISLRKPYKSGEFGIYRENSQRGIQQACLGVYKAFMELSTHKPVKTKVYKSNKKNYDFYIKVCWKNPYSSIKPLIRIAGSGLAALTIILSIQFLLPEGWHSKWMPVTVSLIIGAISVLALHWHNRLMNMEKQFSETKEVIEKQLESLKKGADELLLERNTLENKVKERTRELNAALAQLKALDKAKTNFIANVSHELRTPLTLLSVPLDGFKEGRYGSSIPASNPIFPLMRRNVERLRIQINQLLDFTRLDLDTIPFEPKKISLLSYCRSLTAELESLAQQKGLWLSVINETGKSDLIIDADETLIETALLNLLNNALKFTETGGINLILRLLPGEDKVKLTVKDTGIGFADIEKERIFQRFTQADEHKERHHEGTGLGLALTKEIAIRHNWLLDAKSNPGEGSSFSLTMPLQPEQDEDLPLSYQEHRRARASSGVLNPVVSEETDYAVDRYSILLVEDNPDMVTILRTLLEANYNLHWCGNGTDALEYLEKNPSVALIICDVMMPRMSGFAFREKLIEGVTYKETPFIFLTALADPQDKVQGLESGALDYIQKPFSSSELLLKIHNLLETQKAIYKQALKDCSGTERLLRFSASKELTEKQMNWDHFGITNAEKRVLDLLRRGLQDKEIGLQLSLSTRTISSHLSNLYRKTDTQNRTELLNRLFHTL